MSKVIDNIEDIASIDAKANLASPTFTGTPTLNGEALVKLSSDGLRIEKSNDASIKNQCTAWVNFDGTTTPPTIRDSYNVSSVVRTATGNYDVYFTTPMDNVNYSISGSVGYLDGGNIGRISSSITNKFVNKVTFITFHCVDGTMSDYSYRNSVQIFGGKL